MYPEYTTTTNKPFVAL